MSRGHGRRSATDLRMSLGDRASRNGGGEVKVCSYLLPLPEWPRGFQDAPVSDEDWNKAVSGQ